MLRVGQRRELVCDPSIGQACATAAGIKKAALDECLSSPDEYEAIQQEVQDAATAAAIEEVPSIFVNDKLCSVASGADLLKCLCDGGATAAC